MAKFTTKCFTNAKPITLPTEGYPEWTAVDVEFNPTAYAVNDLISLCQLPEGYRCLDYALVFPTLGAAGTWSLGVSNSTVAVPVSTDIGTGLQVWGAGLTAGQGVAPVRSASSNCAQDAIRSTATIPGDREIVLKATAAFTGYSGAGKVGQVLLLLVQ